jgi:hypothetical protein
MATDQQGLSQPSNGQADWDTDLNANFTIVERGYRGKLVAGAAINTGYIVAVDSAGYARPFNPTSQAALPRALAYKSVASGEEDFFIVRGSVRSLGALSNAVPGETMFVSAVTPGFVVRSYSGANRPIGFGISEDGVYFDPTVRVLPEVITQVTTISAVTGSAHLFSLDIGVRGIVRTLRSNGNSADLAEIKFWSGSARVASELLYETISGGVNVFSKYIDQALFPYDNTEASTLSGLVFGSLKIMSAAAVGSDTIFVQLKAERAF